MRVLSIIIPTYNTELYIERCLDSLLYNKSVVKYLDIIVVNDGGTDRSLEIAKKYQVLFPDSIQIINKKNGGHGSAVNAGIAAAKGKYVRVVDSDDWVNIDDFEEYVNRLREEKADIVVTDVRRQQLYDETELDFRFEEKYKNPIAIDNIKDKIMEDNFFFEFSMHSMTVKLDRLKTVWGEGLLEKTFYVDQQFVAKVIMCARNYVEYPLLIYMYFIGRPEQSMGEGFFKHIDDHERVLRWLLGTTRDEKMPDYYKVVVSRQIVLMLRTHYRAYEEQPKLSRNKRSELANFDKFLRNSFPKYYASARVTNIIKRILNPMKNTYAAKTIHYFRKEKE